MASISRSATRFLISQPSVVATVSQTDSGKPFIFHRKVADNVEKTGKAALVVMDGGYWGDSNDYNTERFKRIRLEFWVGPTRDAQGLVGNSSDTEDRLDAIYNSVDKVLHRMNNEPQLWGDKWVLKSKRIGDLVFYPVNDGIEICYGTAYYGVSF